MTTKKGLSSFHSKTENKKVLNNDGQSLCQGELRKNKCLEALKKHGDR